MKRQRLGIEHLFWSAVVIFGMAYVKYLIEQAAISAAQKTIQHFDQQPQ